MNVLLLDTNVSSYPIYESLLYRGYTVFVAGSNPDDCLALSSTNYLKFDYSDFDLLIQFTKDYDIDFVLPGCNDLSYKMAAKYNQIFKCGLNLESPEIDDIINNKHLFKDFAIRIGLSVPQKINFLEIFEYTDYPIIIKPTDSYSGKGVTVLNEYNEQEVKDAIELAKNNSKSSSFFIEKFVQGQLYSHTTFINNGKIELDFIVEEHCNFYPYAVDQSWVLDHSDCSFLEEIRSEIQKMIAALELKPGLIHTQFIYSNGKVKILEVTRRCPGDLYAKLIEYSTGLNYAKLFTEMVLNLDFDFNYYLKKNKIIRETIHYKGSAYYTIKLETYSNIKEFVPIVKTGSIINKNTSRVGILFYTNEL